MGHHFLTGCHRLETPYCRIVELRCLLMLELCLTEGIKDFAFVGGKGREQIDKIDRIEGFVDLVQYSM